MGENNFSLCVSSIQTLKFISLQLLQSYKVVSSQGSKDKRLQQNLHLPLQEKSGHCGETPSSSLKEQDWMSTKGNNREAMILLRSREEPPCMPLVNAKGKTANVFEMLLYTRYCDQGLKAMYWQQQKRSEWNYTQKQVLFNPKCSKYYR